MMGGLYRPGDSRLHRLPAGAKLLFLAAAGTLAVLVSNPFAMAALLVGSLALFPFAGLSAAEAFRQLRPALPILLLLFLAQLWLADAASAALITMRLAALLLLASLVTLTTRVSDTVDTLERALGPLRRFGVDPARVSLAISLAIRFIPALGTVLSDIREAQEARGLDRHPLALAVPLVVRTLKMADEVAEAIEARS
ncbi:energy-coupling factor transporter transmembrane protein EcfT [Aureimonas sp. SK2]|uniref:energy-coupling factor transporter transmembrane component T family protein n=1 Tax=Aureimonas sp. SK2 TaxID=3015992 RepID=UPI002444EDF9|nr:energy-coupling factor transporter transmembrane protein EcfT [Aureimonas sp. SK2]